MPKIEPFESFSEAYDKWFERNEEKYRLELEAIKVFIHSGRNGLEVGVGSGRFAAPLGIKTGQDLEILRSNRHYFPSRNLK